MSKLNILLIITMTLLVFLSIFASIYRFGIIEDYIVSYEGDCDPETNSCYFDCEDEACTENYYYTVIERNAAEIHSLCGTDVTECDEAYECQPDVEFCEISFCDPEEDGRDTCASINQDNI